ncbi:DNA polymerase delta subunit 3-like [Oopsacas minuta]|uniref:DNA polymerase delta subunit 3 n=1 Tax=Oopsacas minuta TaxID=111878 RepID=A0AAV7KU28_9METZ|nr:DNA polymerase delta subunit 3-like [Oopsacas minuta]
MTFSEEEYLQIIDNWIQCEDKIVTFTHLALELGVTCNHAKSMLYSYVQKARSIPSHPVFPVYLISGYISPKELLVKIVPEKQLESAKSKFIQILSVQIYSICKYIITSPRSIQKALKIITQDRTSTTKLSLIKNSLVGRRTLKFKSFTKDTPVLKPKIEQTIVKTDTPKNEIKINTAVPKVVKHPPKKATTAKPKTINTLQFSAKPIVNKNAITLDEDVKKLEINSQTPTINSESDTDSTDSELELKTRGYFPQSLPSEVVQSHTERPKVTGFLEDDSDYEIPPDDVIEDPQPVQKELMVDQVPKIRINPQTGKKRKRVQRIVSEHSEDARGYLVTKKKYVMVSTDESESEENIQTTIQTKTTYTKQSSLNCFFKK